MAATRSRIWLLVIIALLAAATIVGIIQYKGSAQLAGQVISVNHNGTQFQVATLAHGESFDMVGFTHYIILCPNTPAPAGYAWTSPAVYSFATPEFRMYEFSNAANEKNGTTWTGQRRGYQNTASILNTMKQGREYYVYINADTGAQPLPISCTYDTNASSSSDASSQSSDSSSSVSSSQSSVAAVCGNAIVEPPEQCDDGNTDQFDGCFNNCTSGIPPFPLP